MVEFGNTQRLGESDMLLVEAQAEAIQKQPMSIAGETPEPVIIHTGGNAPEVGSIHKAPDQSVRSRTAAQDLVLRRLRILNKKIGGNNLNADQKAGLASLPGLEAAAKELEDLASGLEAIAKEESAKDEAARLAAESRLRNATDSAVNAYKESCLPLLTALVRVHATLRPSSSPSSNFMASDLPVELQSLSRPDVQVVDELFGLLKMGGAQEVIERIQVLKPTPIGKLLHSEDSSTAESSGSTPVFSPRPLETISLPTEESHSVPDVVQTDSRLDSFRVQPEIAEQPVSRNIQPTKPAQPEMSFIQSSELVEGEVVAHNPPVQEPLVSKIEEKIEESVASENKTAHERKVSRSQPNIAQIVGLNWADDDEDHSGEEELARIRAQFNMPPLASASTDTPIAKPSITAGGPASLPTLAASKSSSLLPTFETPMDAPSHARTVQPPSDIPAQSNKSRSNTRSTSSASANTSQQRQNNAPTIGRGRGRGGFHSAGKPPIKAAEPEPAMEDDGFQIATRRRGPPAHQARGTSSNGRGGNRGLMANRQSGPQRRQG